MKRHRQTGMHLKENGPSPLERNHATDTTIQQVPMFAMRGFWGAETVGNYVKICGVEKNCFCLVTGHLSGRLKGCGLYME